MAPKAGFFTNEKKTAGTNLKNFADLMKFLQLKKCVSLSEITDDSVKFFKTETLNINKN